MTTDDLVRGLPRHINLTIEHNPHATNYESVSDWLERDHAECSEDEAAAMIATGEVWVVHWYPDTPVGFCAVAASTLDRALAAAAGAT